MRINSIHTGTWIKERDTWNTVVTAQHTANENTLKHPCQRCRLRIEFLQVSLGRLGGFWNFLVTFSFFLALTLCHFLELNLVCFDPVSEDEQLKYGLWTIDHVLVWLCFIQNIRKKLAKKMRNFCDDEDDKDVNTQSDIFAKYVIISWQCYLALFEKNHFLNF